ncbi:iron-sulfur cluster biosynthesis family protein [Brevibacillus fulvus]|uniref:Iron-sulfur cluster assembly protein n=1 Tax=Brevibacillus fulvus TaxID=1125967 RepID=A0A939BRL0_9BACL|nr:iron-sulfur cluster biosynthesis family protein [Brevibacillus fulvus]MBM7589742.1 iron-sulfur cluster assembly protein [Brevibacillus fulvus]
MSIQLQIDPEFALAYQRYADFKPGDKLRLYVRTGGPGSGGLQFAIQKDEIDPDDAVFEVAGLRFLIRPADFWYFDGAKLTYNPVYGEYGFEYANPRLAD